MKDFFEFLINYPLWVRVTVLIMCTAIVFLLINFRPTSKPDGKVASGGGVVPQISVGRDIVAGRDIVISNPRYLYLTDKYLMEGILRQGWYLFKIPDELLENLAQDVNIFPIGLANHRLGFLVASGPGAHCKVELLYLKLKAYAPCELRDEYTTITAFMGLTTYSFYISEEYDVYPIYAINDSLTRTAWKYQGKDVDEFSVYLSFKDYILYLITINIDYIDLHTNKRKHVETDEFALINTAHGNTGGCLDVRRWFTNDMRQQPTQRRYDEEIPFDVYQLLCADFRRNPGLMNIFVKNHGLAMRQAEVESVVKGRPENATFAENYKAWIKALDVDK